MPRKRINPLPDPSDSPKSSTPDDLGIGPAKRAEVLRLLFSGRSVKEAAQECGISGSTVYRLKSNLVRYGSVRRPPRGIHGRPRKLSVADEEAVLEFLLREPWRKQCELVIWLREERDIKVNQAAICRLFKRRGWSPEELKRLSLARSENINGKTQQAEQTMPPNGANVANHPLVPISDSENPRPPVSTMVVNNIINPIDPSLSNPADRSG